MRLPFLRPRTLRVAVSPATQALPPRDGHGRVWAQVLAGLRERVRVQDDGAKADVWLVDGAAELPQADAPLVALVHEAPWADPALAALLAPDFLALFRDRTEAAVRAAARIVVPSA